MLQLAMLNDVLALLTEHQGAGTCEYKGEVFL